MCQGEKNVFYLTVCAFYNILSMDFSGLSAIDDTESCSVHFPLGVIQAVRHIMSL